MGRRVGMGVGALVKEREGREQIQETGKEDTERQRR